MGKLIDSQVAIEMLCSKCTVDKPETCSTIQKGDNWCEEVYILQRVPSAQKKGHWIDEGTNYACSECHRGCWVNSDYCPWCGADMRGERHE